MARTVAANIAAAMEARGLNALELSKRAGLNPTAVYDILKGKIKNPRIDTIAKIAGALGVTPSSLLEDRRLDEVRSGLLAAVEAMSPEDCQRLLDVARTWRK
jgi:transcriptional regulator with XRE-family HTH domain